MLDKLNRLIKQQGDDTQDDNACDHHIQLENLGTVYDQISQASPGGKEFTDDYAYQSQTDIDFGGAEQDGNRAGQHYLEKSVLLSAAQRVDQSDFFRIYLLKAGIKADNGAENSHGDSGYDDGFCPGAQPYDKERGQS